MVLGGIVIAFVCAFFSLAQDVRVSAVGYEVDRLTSEHRDLEDELRDIRNELNRLGRAPAIRKLAIDAGLAPLSEPLIVPAR
jgi:cell division protein FtsL